MFRFDRAGSEVILNVDGPASLLKQSTKYGLQLATFFPAVLLQECMWRLEATVLWGTKRKLKKSLSLDSGLGLVSHYRDQGGYETQTQAWFVSRFEELDSDWQLSAGEPIDLGSQRLLIPDLTFRRDGRIAHLDIVGFWRSGYLKRRVEMTPPNVVLAVSRRLAGDSKKFPAALADQVVSFGEIIPVKQVLEMFDRIAIPQRGVER